MWSSDGTTAGTHRLTDTQIPNSSNPGSFAAIDNSPPTVANAAVSAITDQQTNHPFQNVVIGDTDLPAQTLTVTVTPDDAAKGQFTAASLTASGFVAGGVNGSYTYTGTDEHGATGTATLTFNITGQEDGPAAVANTVTATEDVAASASTRVSGLLGNDTDVDTGEAATLKVSGAHFGAVADTVVASSGTTTIHGTYGDLHVAADGTYDYTPNTATAEALTQGQAASDVFSYTITDAQGQTSTSTVTFNVTGANDTPVGTNNSASVNEDATTSTATRATGVLGNAPAVDTGEPAPLKVSGAHFGAVADHAHEASGKTTIHGTYGDLQIAAEGT